MRKINVSMDMFGNTKEKRRKKKRKKNRKRNRICYYEDLTPSWQGSINVLPTFVHSFFCVGEGISFLAQWLDNPIYIYSRSYKGFSYELSLKKFDTKNNLEAFQVVF